MEESDAIEELLEDRHVVAFFKALTNHTVLSVEDYFHAVMTCCHGGKAQHYSNEDGEMTPLSVLRLVADYEGGSIDSGIYFVQWSGETGRSPEVLVEVDHEVRVHYDRYL